MNKGSAKLCRLFSFIFVLSFNQSHFFFLFGQLSLVIEQSPSLSFVDSHFGGSRSYERKQMKRWKWIRSWWYVYASRITKSESWFDVIEVRFEKWIGFLSLPDLWFFWSSCLLVYWKLREERVVWCHWWNIHREFSRFFCYTNTLCIIN